MCVIYRRMCSQLHLMVVALSVLVLVSMVSAAPRGEILAQLLQNEADTKEDKVGSSLLCMYLLWLLRYVLTLSFRTPQ